MYNFTQEDLLQYLYEETSVEKTASIKSALLTDWSLREKMECLIDDKKKLDTIKLLSPRQQAIDKILNYAERAVPSLSE